MIYVLVRWTETGIKWSETLDLAEVDKWMANPEIFKWAFIRENGRHIQEIR